MKTVPKVSDKSKLAEAFAELVVALRMKATRQELLNSVLANNCEMDYKGFTLLAERLTGEVRLYLTYNNLIPKLKNFLTKREDKSFLSFSVLVGNSNIENDALEIRVGVFGLECDIAAKALIFSEGMQ